MRRVDMLNFWMKEVFDDACKFLIPGNAISSARFAAQLYVEIVEIERAAGRAEHKEATDAE